MNVTTPNVATESTKPLSPERKHFRVYVNTFRCKQCVGIITVQEIQPIPRFCVWCGSTLTAD